MAIIDTGTAYRDRALSGIVRESGLAQTRELASQEFKREKIEGIGTGIEWGIMTAINIVSGAFHSLGMMPEKDEGGGAGGVSGLIGNIIRRRRYLRGLEEEKETPYSDLQGGIRPIMEGRSDSLPFK